MTRAEYRIYTLLVKTMMNLSKTAPPMFSFLRRRTQARIVPVNIFVSVPVEKFNNKLGKGPSHGFGSLRRPFHLR